MLVKGKKALVFGGTSGIGLAAAMMLRDEGCDVVAISRDPASAQITKDGVTGIKTLANNVCTLSIAVYTATSITVLHMHCGAVVTARDRPPVQAHAGMLRRGTCVVYYYM
jgi:short-subunit dehydrogenase involved in D-alanine esterification of teichoic acids